VVVTDTVVRWVSSGVEKPAARPTNDGGGAEQNVNATFEAGELVDTSAFFQEMHVRDACVLPSCCPTVTESRTVMRGLAMTVHGTLLRRKSAVDIGIIASPARRCIGTRIIIVAYRHGGGGCVAGRAMTCLSPRAKELFEYRVRSIDRRQPGR
jgi:hypothetical protein